MSFRKKFPGNNDKEWTADFKWINSGETESSDYVQDDMIGGGKLVQRSANPAYEDNISLQTDYVSSFGKEGKFETGFKGTIRKITNEYLVEEQTNGGTWVTLPAFDNNMEFTERVYAAYGMLGIRSGNSLTSLACVENSLIFVQDLLKLMRLIIAVILIYFHREVFLMS